MEMQQLHLTFRLVGNLVLHPIHSIGRICGIVIKFFCASVNKWNFAMPFKLTNVMLFCFQLNEEESKIEVRPGPGYLHYHIKKQRAKASQKIEQKGTRLLSRWHQGRIWDEPLKNHWRSELESTSTWQSAGGARASACQGSQDTGV